MSRSEDERFDDLVYDAWRAGKNPDSVSRDRYDDRLAEGFYPDEISLQDVLPSPRPVAPIATAPGELADLPAEQARLDEICPSGPAGTYRGGRRDPRGTGF